MRLSIAEILSKAGTLSGAEQVAWLREHDCLQLRQLLRCIYDPSIQIALPDSTPPWDKNDYLDVEGKFYTETRRLKIWIVGGGYDHLPKVRREDLFISLLKAIDNRDAELLSTHFTTKKPLPGLTEAGLLEAFSGLFSTKLW